METVSEEEAEPLILNMRQFLNTDTDLESLFINTACVCVHTHPHTYTYTRVCVMFINSVVHLSAYRFY